MLAIIIALESEISNAKNIQSENELIISNDQKFYLNSEKQIVFVFSGVGKVNAASCISNLLKTFPNINRVINIGMAGCSEQKFELGSIVTVDKHYYLDVDATIFGYKYGQVPKEDEYYLSSKEDKRVIDVILNKNNFKQYQGNIGTSDSFVNKDNVSKFPKEIIDNIVLFDMESTAIAHICFKNEISFSSIKVVSDNIYTNSKEINQFTSSIINYAKLIENIIFSIIFSYHLFK